MLRPSLPEAARVLRSLPHLLTALAERPLRLAAAVGLVVAWPLADAAPAWRAALALGFALATPLTDLRPGPPGRGARAASSAGLLGLVGLAIAQRLPEPGFGLVALIGATWALLHTWRPRETQAPPPLATLALSVAVTVAPRALPVPRLAPLLLLAVIGLALRWTRRGRDDSNLVDVMLASPARLLVLSFAALSSIGAVLLTLPPSSTSPGSIRLLDALFTAVSAACVTGLAVLDTAGDFTRLGQAVLLALIQLGGLGIMTFAATAAIFLGRRLGVREEAMAATLAGASEHADLVGALRTVLKVTAVAELAGAVALTPLFAARGDGLPDAAWRAVFTSVSAFCNAGFALQSDSLVPYQDSPAILLVLSALIVAGGLGPLVIAALPAWRHGRAPLHVRVVLVTTAALLLVPAALFLVLEWDGTLRDLRLVDKLTNAWFLSVTLRTAGFNAIDFGAIQPATWTLCILCMFVGGSPGSTAGGAKTTTLAVLVLAVVAAVRGRPEVTAFGRRVPHRTIYEATAIATVGVLLAAAALMAVQVTQAIPLDQALFEVVSALGTVGLTMGATSQLDDVGKVIVILCMFAGRVGPLTLFIFLVGQTRRARRFPLEALQVG